MECSAGIVLAGAISSAPAAANPLNASEAVKLTPNKPKVLNPAAAVISEKTVAAGAKRRAAATPILPQCER